MSLQTVVAGWLLLLLILADLNVRPACGTWIVVELNCGRICLDRRLPFALDCSSAVSTNYDAFNCPIIG
jgi:hypothetical protein